MRVLHILDHSVPTQTGYTFRTLAILREQQALGWKTFHLTSQKQGPMAAAEEQVDGWHFYRTPASSSVLDRIPGLAEIKMMSGFARRIEEVAHGVRPDLLHAHSPVLNAIPALRVGRRLGIPVVYEVRAIWEDAAVDHGTAREGGLRYRLSRAVETWALRRADAVTTICEGLRREIVARGIPDERVTVIPNAVDVEQFSAGVPEASLKSRLGLNGAPVLGFIGSFYAYEGLVVLLRALARLLAQGEHVRVLLVGGGRQEEELKRLAVELGIAERVVFAGRVPHAEVQRYYDLIDVLVYPRLPMRLTELVTPLKPLEAMAQGRLLVASDVGGHRELIRPGETGTLFKAGDAEALAATVAGLLREPARWPSLKTAARRYVETERTWKSSVARYESVYARLTQAATTAMKVLTFSTLYPNAARPRHGIFVETQLRQMLASGRLESVVVAPVPWFPSRDARFGEYALHARAPQEEQRHGIRVVHPRYLAVPKVGMTLAPFLLAQSVKRAVERVLAQFPFDLIDAHYFYPDGVAAVLLGRHLGKPVVISALGTDVNLIPNHWAPRQMILWAARHAAGMIAVARALKDRLVDLGVPAARIEVLRNGVDLQLFRPVDREAARRRLGFRRTTLLSVGNLVALKGHDVAIQALRLLPDMALAIIGDGPERNALNALARTLGVGDRVTFAPVMGQEDLRLHYGAADALVLASSREGWANVLLESMACGTPVIATRAGGTPEVVSAPEAGVLMDERTPEALAEAAQRLFASYPDRGATRRFAEGYSWDSTSDAHLQLFNRAVSSWRECAHLSVKSTA